MRAGRVILPQIRDEVREQTGPDLHARGVQCRIIQQRRKLIRLAATMTKASRVSRSATPALARAPTILRFTSRSRSHRPGTQ